MGGVEHCGGCSFEWEIGLDLIHGRCIRSGCFQHNTYPIDLLLFLYTFQI